ncbi:hypothetical protein IGI04_013441 [Brassica rapa subsp. trilocularis]|uniref:Defensin-like protein n=2 Tax=Brassica campestris TaxID=3711 RepID=A0A3P6AF56_BRACM|nr:defensin-like protein 182 [Brassica rapa]KAG5407322.1 hypothetical protein IGI04_013441 [Brassica rapa subsp. trilocularis]CAG7884729.1 unnamed protein product [Brassica rapa]VDC83780.1 unnamed protein product [Brassica rapa]
MERIIPLVLLVSLLIISASVVNQTRADMCVDRLYTCDYCEQRCKSKHGPSGQGECETHTGMPMCMCHYQCEPPSLTPLNTCNGGAGLCSVRCPQKCCDINCALKFTGGSGMCFTLGNTSVCQCKYPC